MKQDQASEITKGNAAATAFILSFVAFCHLLDDIVDKDKNVTDKDIVQVMLNFLEQIIINEWARTHIGLLWPLIVSGANSWLDANKWAKSVNGLHQQASDILKGQYHEVIWFTAYLCAGGGTQGLQHQQEITFKYRDYDFEASH